MKNSFEDIKSRVLELIAENRHREVSRKTCYQNSGIYMLYVDCFTDDRIIPFYIGQTNNFQERHKKHLTDLLSLNRLDQRCYEYALLNGLYDGRYRPCKIFSYMLKHDCTLNNFHMVILEIVDDETQRLVREAEYINDLFAPFFGFNQLNCVSKRIDLSYGKCDKAEFRSIVEKDFTNLMQYTQFGYSLFNWYLVHSMVSEKRVDDFLSTISNPQYSQIVWDKKRVNENQEETGKIKRYILFQAEKEALEICQTTIKEFFSKYGLRSTAKQELVVKTYLFERENDLKELNTYFKRCKECIQENIFDVLNEKHGAVLSEIKDKISKKQEQYQMLEEEGNVLLRKMFSLLLSPKEYKSHPLHSLYDGHLFVRNQNEENVCYINIEFTCFKRDFWNDISPEICKIDYLIVRNGKTHSRSVFIQNALTNFFDSDEVYYYEKGFSAGPFNPYLVGNVGTCISVAMEYKNGINEHTLFGAPAEDAAKVLKEIDKLIDNSTKVIYSTSGYKSSIKSYVDLKNYKNIGILKRIAHQCR